MCEACENNDDEDFTAQDFDFNNLNDEEKEEFMS